MPQQNLSRYLGKSPSKVANTVIQNNKNVQQPLPATSATKSAFNKHPVNPNTTGSK